MKETINKMDNIRATAPGKTEERKMQSIFGNNNFMLPFPDRRRADRRKTDGIKKIYTDMKKLTVVIPALNEEQAIGDVVDEIPVRKLAKIGYAVEVMVIDNGSKDKTKYIAGSRGARVIVQPIRGYGNAYKAGFSNAVGDIIATGDADMTYPFSVLPEIIKEMEEKKLDFINTNRLKKVNTKVMKRSHIFGNYFLTFIMNFLFRTPFRDSQSGMWIFKREIWDTINVVSSGMPFSQEIKIEAFLKGYKCHEIPIQYRARAGEAKLNTIKDGIRNTLHLFIKRFRTLFDLVSVKSTNRENIPIAQ